MLAVSGLLWFLLTLAFIVFVGAYAGEVEGVLAVNWEFSRLVSGLVPVA